MVAINGNDGYNTLVREEALKLDAKDGKADGKISASVWNEYAKEYGAPQIQNFIKLENAIKTMEKYGVELPEEEIETSEEVNQKIPTVVSNYPYPVAPSYSGPVASPDTVTVVLKENGEDSFYECLMQNIKYPEDAKDNLISGLVQAELTIDPETMESDIKIRRSPDESLSKSFLDALKKMPGVNCFFERAKVNNGKCESRGYGVRLDKDDVCIKHTFVFGINYKLQ